MAEEKKLSVAEILAAARKMDGVSSGSNQPDSSGTDALKTAAAPADVEQDPVPVKAQAGKPTSVAEMLAMARAETQGGSKPKEVPPASSAAKASPTSATKTAASKTAASKTDLC